MFQFIEVNPSEVQLGCNDVRNDARYVYDHLKFCCTKNELIPAFEVREINGGLISVDRHIYLAIARELGRKNTRAVIIDTTFDELRMRGVRGLIRLIPNDVLKREVDSMVDVGWHIFFFKEHTSPETADKISTKFRTFLEASLPDILQIKSPVVLELEFDIPRACLSIKFPTPSNYDWYRSFRVLCFTIDTELLPIATYQGARWDGMSLT